MPLPRTSLCGRRRLLRSPLPSPPQPTSQAALAALHSATTVLLPVACPYPRSSALSALCTPVRTGLPRSPPLLLVPLASPLACARVCPCVLCRAPLKRAPRSCLSFRTPTRRRPSRSLLPGQLCPSRPPTAHTPRGCAGTCGARHAPPCCFAPTPPAPWHWTLQGPLPPFYMCLHYICARPLPPADGWSACARPCNRCIQRGQTAPPRACDTHPQGPCAHSVGDDDNDDVPPRWRMRQHAWAT
jgi:hypothetical protein